MSPYQEAWQWIERNPGTGSANSLAKLLLSIWNSSNAFSLRECTDNLDAARLQLALRVVEHFTSHGENRELVDIGYKICEVCPRLYELGQAAWDAKRALKEKWHDAGAEENRSDRPSLNEPVQQAQITINGTVLTHDQVRTIVAGLGVIGRIAGALKEARGDGGTADAREAQIEHHQPRARELRALILSPALVTSSTQEATPGRVRLTFELDADRHEAFMRLWHEFVGGETIHDRAIRQRAGDRNQGIASLRELVSIAQGNSGQCRYIARFLAGLYNGPRFPFDLTDLRAIDDALFEHAMAVLRMDHAPAKEVHTYFVDGSELWEEHIIKRWDLDKETTLHAAYLLAGFLEGSEDVVRSDLARRINTWRERERRDR